MRNASPRRAAVALVIAFGAFGAFSAFSAAAWPGLAAAQTSEQQAQIDKQDAALLVKALDLHPGSTVGEIGAGYGEMSVLIARAVGDTGRVFSNDLNETARGKIAENVKKAGLSNVTIVAGDEKITNLPARCCDAIFMRAVYHHFHDPASMNASLAASLKPGGRLAIIDFTPPPGAESADPAHRGDDGHHGVTPETVERELTAAGFTIVSRTENDRAFTVVASVK